MQFAASSEIISEFFEIRGAFACYPRRRGDIAKDTQYVIGDSLLRRVAANVVRRTANAFCGAANSSDLPSRMIAIAIGVIVWLIFGGVMN
jgi:hypothetical protein